MCFACDPPNIFKQDHFRRNSSSQIRKMIDEGASLILIAPLAESAESLARRSAEEHVAVPLQACRNAPLFIFVAEIGGDELGALQICGIVFSCCFPGISGNG